MNDSVESNAADPDKPVSPSQSGVDIFPPIPDPTDADFEEEIGEEEREHYKLKYIDLNDIKSGRLHCTSCDRHLGCVVLKSNKMKIHPMLRTLVCNTCHTFYNSGEFEKGDDGSELYCRWCGQGGQVYCCSDCPHVFCAKCIKRNLGTSKIKEIENTDDWKCFKCTPKCLWDLRALCWATFRYCDFKNKIIDSTADKELKDKYLKAVENDEAKCCREKRKRQSTANLKKKEENSKKKDDKKPDEKPPMLKFPSTIQVKKFASINLSDKTQKRSVSPKAKINYMAKPIAIAPYIQPIRPVYTQPAPKRMRAPNTPTMLRQLTPIEKRTFIGYTTRMIRPNPQMTIPFTMMDQTTNGYNNYVSDNLNLSIENLTQGLDMNAVAAMANSSISNNVGNDDLVCTPDLPMEHLEPLCEVNEDNTDDDIECISPAPQVRKSANNSSSNRKRKANDDNIIQMTENDVTVNAVTGGLKFRVDPQTLSSNKMYRLPDGRIFAINPNPNMPGGYSATIVAVTENNSTVAKGTTYAAKVSAVTSNMSNPPPLSKLIRSNLNAKSDRGPKIVAAKVRDKSPKKCDLKVPVEWYRFNLVDAVDALEYSLMRLKRLKKDATTTFLRTRTVQETRSLHRTLDRLLNTSESRFSEIRRNLNKGFKQYLHQKASNSSSVHESDDEDDDDDVEILPNDNDDDPIFIDENSVDSIKDNNDNQEVEIVSSDLNDSTEKNYTINSQEDTPEKTDENAVDPLIGNNEDSSKNDSDVVDKSEENDNGDTDNAKETDELSKDPEVTDLNDVEMSETVPNTNKENSEDNLLDNSKDEEKGVEKSHESNLLEEADASDGNKNTSEDTPVSCEPQDTGADNKTVGDKSQPVNNDAHASDNDSRMSDDEGKTNVGKEMSIEDSNVLEDNSKTGDVDMSADTIESLLNDDVDDQNPRNDDDNKSIESGEFII